ncbi:uncharacterized protein LOC724922 [Apis mellifera]|uniref:Uncharacterized protein LOC724922 n=1 Tax=Apis mellifera TaxID=7460 RepID=A0A7M7IFJ1_APIME|nr:uncharacterized protein LOC724922 [Apis mellifera]|eukprot:XP_016767343.2 uncharacterized protein LOC724922 [Apis mellifera]
MDAIWNQMELERPPNATCQIDNKIFDATKFLLMLDRIIKDLTSQELLHKEAAILSRLLYRMKTKFRNDKGVKSMSKVNKALLKYLSLSLEKEYEKLKNNVEINEKYVTLPSKQMVEYVLIRTQSFTKIMLRVEEISKYTAHFLKCRINLGHAWSIALIAYAVISRIWILSRYLIKKACTWYNDLYHYLNLLKIVGLHWLTEKYELTNDLKSWLSIPWVDEPIPSIPNDYGIKTTMFKLITPWEYDSDEDLIYNIQDYNKEVKSENIFSLTKNENIVHNLIPNENKNIISNDDTGEIIDRHDFNLKCIQSTSMNTKEENKKFSKTKENKRKQSDENNQEFYIGNIANKFIIKEKDINSKIELKNLTKKKSLKKLLTFHDVNDKSDLIVLLNKESYPGLDKLRWNIIKNKSKKLLDKLDVCSNETKQIYLFKKILKRIKKWIV